MRQLCGLVGFVALLRVVIGPSSWGATIYSTLQPGNTWANPGQIAVMGVIDYPSPDLSLAMRGHLSPH